MVKRRRKHLEFHPLELAAQVILTMLLLRLIAVVCIKIAAAYAAKGDARQANRFERLARRFARMSYMFAEMDEDVRRSPS